jgi:small subunit ribosomal protein S6
MICYEALLLARPEITGDEAAAIEKSVDRMVKEVKGSLISFDRWGKYRLSYPIAKNEYGIYFLARFEIEITAAPVLEELRTLFAVKFNDFIMRSMVTRLVGKNLEYNRPMSLEDTPSSSRDVNTFLRENKMEGLLSSVDKDDEDEDDDNGSVGMQHSYRSEKAGA